MISDERLKELGDDNTICKVSWDERVEMARELLALRKAHEGWQLVPVEPTQQMIDAHTEGMISGGASKAYRAMLAAAPEPE